MPDCEEAVYSNDYFDFLATKEYMEDIPPGDYCVQQLDEDYLAVYDQMRGRELKTGDFSYGIIPKCFGLLNNLALGESGILKVRDQPNLSLTGRGVLVGFIDTDFDYTNPLFCNTDGTTRVERIWNQKERSGMPPRGFLYGTEYTREQINEELMANHDSMTAKIPYADGHGTFLAALAAGSEDFNNQFSGAAPECDIAFVQLKPAKQYLKDFYFIPDETPVFQENDIMAGIRYLNMLAIELRKPLSICIALGTNMGNRGGASPLAHSLNEVSERRQRCVVVACGNEADKRHHFLGGISGQNAQERVEISVSDGVQGFIAEMWAEAPELYEVTVISPTGERFRALPTAPGSHTEYRFLFEGTVATVDYLLTGAANKNELIYIRFTKPIAGIWILNVSVRNFADGIYHVWPANGRHGFRRSILYPIQPGHNHYRALRRTGTDNRRRLQQPGRERILRIRPGLYRNQGNQAGHCSTCRGHLRPGRAGKIRNTQRHKRGSRHHSRSRSADAGMDRRQAE